MSGQSAGTRWTRRATACLVVAPNGNCSLDNVSELSVLAGICAQRITARHPLARAIKPGASRSSIRPRSASCAHRSGLPLTALSWAPIRSAPTLVASCLIALSISRSPSSMSYCEYASSTPCRNSRSAASCGPVTFSRYTPGRAVVCRGRSRASNAANGIHDWPVKTSS